MNSSRRESLEEPHLGSTGGDVGGSTAVKATCCILQQTFGPDQLILSDSPLYAASRSRYWSAQQASVQTVCFLLPKSTHEVQSALKVLLQTRCPFAIRSGGHTPYAGGSSIHNGITLSLENMNRISVSEDRTTVSIGPGCRWLDVYDTLEPIGLTVVGGRVASVGVGGLILGGGISFHSNLHGWACDNVVNFEVVTAGGDIVNANETTNQDLFWALRGGGNSLGVVTRFDVKAFPQGRMWGGNRYHPLSQSAKLIQQMIAFGERGVVEDPKASLIIGFVWTEATGYFSSVSLQHTDADSDSDSPKVFHGLLNVPEVLGDSCSSRTLSNLTMELDGISSGDGHKMRQSFWTFTTYLDENLLSEIVELFVEESKALTHVKGILSGVGLQVISMGMIKHMARAGGNCLGLEGETRPLLLANPSVRWKSQEDDRLVLDTYKRFVKRAQENAAARGLGHDFLYKNYASQFQKANSYGEDNERNLLQVNVAYDPNGLFRSLVAGHLR